jgi:hypothetical protein
MYHLPPLEWQGEFQALPSFKPQNNVEAGTFKLKDDKKCSFA